jgi:TetR/AcrR family transcriptional regulator, regulator of autoinduction and epiphytic fitness
MSTVPTVDGRSARGARNRRAIVEGALALVLEKGDIPTTQEIAARAGIAPRSVFHHFPSLDALLAEAAQIQAERWWSLLSDPEPDRTLAERLARALRQRVELFEAIGGVRRVAVRRESSSALLAERLAFSRGALRDHLRRCLNPELSALDEPAIAGIEAAGSWEMWDLLRRDLPVDAALAAVAALIEPALTREPGTREPGTREPGSREPGSREPGIWGPMARGQRTEELRTEDLRTTSTARES